MATRWARVLRGFVAAVFAVFIAGFAHVAGGGNIPSLAGAAVALAFATLACIALAGRSLSVWRLGFSVALSQGAFHVLFWLTGTGSSAIGAGAASGVRRMMAMREMVPAELFAGSSGSGSGSTMPDDVWMWLAHALAAALTVAALLWGETAFWSLLDAARLALTRATRWTAELPHRPEIAPIFILLVDRRAAHFLLTGLRHRGPPRVAASA